MSKFTTIRNAVTRPVMRGTLYVRKYSPQVLTATGVVGLVGTAVLAARATSELSPVLEEFKTNRSATQEAREKLSLHEYDQQTYITDLVITHRKLVTGVLKVYGPAILLGSLSIAAILGSHKIMHARNLAMAAAYKALEEGYNRYRSRVVEDLGIEVDKDYAHGILRNQELLSTDDEGRDTKVTGDATDRYGASPYSFIFDDQCPSWEPDSTVNRFFLASIQNYANEKLRLQGHLFLNDVLDTIGLPKTPAGQLVGWLGRDGDGDNFIDFQMELGDRNWINDKRRAAIFLDFNVDGMIYDKI